MLKVTKGKRNKHTHTHTHKGKRKKRKKKENYNLPCTKYLSMRTENSWNFHKSLKTVCCQLSAAWTYKKPIGMKKILFSCTSDELLWFTIIVYPRTFCYTHHSNRLSEHVHQVHTPLSPSTCFGSYHTVQDSLAELTKKYITLHNQR
jgi:hypothetical protein